MTFTWKDARCWRQRAGRDVGGTDGQTPQTPVERTGAALGVCVLTSTAGFEEGGPWTGRAVDSDGGAVGVQGAPGGWGSQAGEATGDRLLERGISPSSGTKQTVRKGVQNGC